MFTASPVSAISSTHLSVKILNFTYIHAFEMADISKGIKHMLMILTESYERHFVWSCNEFCRLCLYMNLVQTERSNQPFICD